MVNHGLALVDCLVEGKRARSLVEYNSLDLEHFKKLTRGTAIFDPKEGLTFASWEKQARFHIASMGELEILFEDNLFGNAEAVHGTIGKVARAYNADAYEKGGECLVNVTHSDDAAAQVAAYPFRVYKLGEKIGG